jgi:excisionase family DNA binding protein
VLVTLQEAAAAAGVSASTMRRWADEGRVRAVRTAGGHRRFALETVRKVAGERANRPTVRPVAMPADRLAPLADHLRAHGAELAARAASALYRGGPPGWFGADEASEAVREWVGALAAACDSARYADAAAASELLMRRAYLHGASLLERHTFLERFGELALRSLSLEGADRVELTGTRRLITALQQTLLDGG